MEHLKGTAWVSCGLTRKHQTRLKRLTRDKHCSLLRKVVTYDRKKFYKIVTRCSQRVLVRLSRQGCTVSLCRPVGDKNRLAPFSIENFIIFFTKQATLMGRSTVLTPPLQLILSQNFIFFVTEGSMLHNPR